MARHAIASAALFERHGFHQASKAVVSEAIRSRVVAAGQLLVLWRPLLLDSSANPFVGYLSETIAGTHDVRIGLLQRVLQWRQTAD